MHHGRRTSGSLSQTAPPPSSFGNGSQLQHQPRGAPPPPPPPTDPSTGMNLRVRPVPSVPPPAVHKPADGDLFLIDGQHKRIKHDYLKDHFFREGRLKEQQALYILEQVTNVLSREPNMVNVKSPVTICGDIHGQYYDLMKMFEVGGSIKDSTYLFLGDYVDRGDFGIECLLYLYALKISHPTRIILLRGNHECRHLTEYFTFKKECLHKYSQNIYEACVRSFCALPVAALVDGKFFCVHGGISPQLMTLRDLETINRHQEPGSHGLLCDLLWSDPISQYGTDEEPRPMDGSAFVNNGVRGCSYFYTYNAVCQFLERNNLLTLIRGHEAQDAGYTIYRKTPKRNFPSLITIFSAPNYLDVYKNRGAILKYANKNITIRQYNSSSHPYWLPNFMDAFTWSLPFVGLKKMLLAILSICTQEELAESDDSEGEVNVEDIAARRQLIKNKILAVGRMQKVFQLLREEAENATELELPADVPGAPGAANRGLSVQGHRSIRTFDDARRVDLANERLPNFDAHGAVLFPVPSMRLTSRRSSTDGIDMEDLIKRTLDEDTEEGSAVELLAEKIARGRHMTGRPSALKRHGTA